MQQALPVEQQSTSMQQIQSQSQLQSQIVAAPTEQHTKLQPHRTNSQYNPSPEKSKGSLYIFTIHITFHFDFKLYQMIY